MNHQAKVAVAITRMAKSQQKVRRMVRKLAPTRLRQKISVEEVVRARNRAAEKGRTRSTRSIVSLAAKECRPTRYRNYFLLDGGAATAAGFKSVANFCKSATSEAFSS